MDLLLALRGIRRTPGFAALVVLTLAIGIGATTTMYTLVRAVFLRPLPFPEPERLVTVWERDSSRKAEDRRLTPANFVDWRARSRSFEELGVLPNWSGPAWKFNVLGGDRPERVDGIYASSGFFRALGVRPLLGRTLDEADDRSAGRRHVVIDFRYWQDRFGGDRGVVGKTLHVDTFRGGAFEIVGVMPPGFDLPHGARIWLSLGDWGAGPMPVEDAAARCCAWYTVIGRLKVGVSARQAESELTALARRTSEMYPSAATVTDVKVTPMRETLIGSHRFTLLAIFAAAGCVLLIGCANVANLLLARGIGRRREMLTREALGATPWRIMRQLLTEGIVLSGAGAVAGLWFSLALLPVVRRLLQERVSLAEQAVMDWNVWLFAAALSAVCGLLCTLAPLADWRRAAGSDRSHTTSVFHTRLRNALVVGEIAAAVMLVTVAGLLIRTVDRLGAVDMGFRTEHLLTLSTDVTTGPLRTRGASARFVDEAVARIGGLPGVRSVAATTALPFEAAPASQAITREGVAARAAADSPQVIQIAVTPSYFATMGMALKAGRLLTENDRAEGTLVAVLNETAARRYWPGEDPIGKRFAVGSRERFGSFRRPPPGGVEWREIVGVVQDIRSGGQRAPVEPEVYYSHKQFPIYSPTLVVRTAGQPGTLAGAARQAIEGAHRNAIITAVRTMDTVAAEAIGDSTMRAVVAGAFSLVAVALGMLGVYGVMAYTVAQRSREIGIRMALGARESQAAGMVVRQAMLLTAAGVVLGLALATMAARLIATFLFGVGTSDPLTLAGTCAVLALGAVAASYVPARRAARVDPTVALRHE
jgi:putative ABC transport system permease protein